MNANKSLDSLIFWRDWHKTDKAQKLFPSLESLRWFVRNNETSLADSGALVFLRSRWYFVQPDIDHVMIDIVSKATRKIVADRRSVR